MLYDEGIQVGLLFEQMYKMDMYELTDTIEYRRKGMGYAIWRLASLTRSPWVQNFPEKPEDACPELFPQKKGIPMEQWMIDKYIKGR